MTTSTTNKRLNNIEVYLTPKEWAIRLADEIRRYPSMDDAMRAEFKGHYEESLCQKPYRLLGEQAEEREPGRTVQNAEARRRLRRKLQSDFHLLKTIILNINLGILQGAEGLRLKVALRLSQLHSLVLQDAFASTAQKSLSWVSKGKGSLPDKDERRVMLADLTGYAAASFAVIEDWTDDIVSLLAEVFTCRSAVQIIEGKYFDGHAILYRDIEDGLDEALKTIEGGIAAFNEYVKTREVFFKTKRARSAGAAERQRCTTIDLDGIRDEVKKMSVVEYVDQCVKHSKEMTEVSNLEASGDHDGYVAFEWHRLRKVYGLEA
jgi:hypothetical protein